MRLLFVCLGNICRSPTAEGVMRHLLVEQGLAEAVEIDSAGTGDWHVGHAPDHRSAGAASGRGIELTGAARQVALGDFGSFDLILAMDRSNHDDLLALAPDEDTRERVKLLREYDPDAVAVVGVRDLELAGGDGLGVVIAQQANPLARVLVGR